MKTIIVSALFSAALLCSAAYVAPSEAARVPESVQAQTELSLSVKGLVAIDAQGLVSGVELTSNDALTDSLKDFVRQQVMAWEFEPPTDGELEQAAQTPVSLKLVARRGSDGGMTVRIVAAHFGNDADIPAEQRLGKKDLKPPHYPLDVFEMGGSGVVYLLLKIDAEGKVADSGVSRVNLTRAGSERQMARIRERLASAALAAANSWTYQVPTVGLAADQPYWLVNVPVNFALAGDDRQNKSRGWEVYIPGPRLDIPWYRQGVNDRSNAMEAMPEGEPTLLGMAGPTLKTELGG